MYVIAVGNPFDGIQLVGPFDNYSAAERHAEDECGNDYNIVEVSEPGS